MYHRLFLIIIAILAPSTILSCAIISGESKEPIVTVVERGTFEIRDTNIRGVQQSALESVLRAYVQKHPGERYELLCEQKRQAEQSQALEDIFSRAGAPLVHHWVPVGMWEDSYPIGPYGSGIVDLKARESNN